MERVTQSDSNNLENDHRDDLSSLEALIYEERLDGARQVLRSFLFSQAGISGAGEPIGDALALLAKQPSNHALAAIVLLRCFAIRGLVPEPNSTNNIIRSTVALCGEALPDIADFLKIDKCSQNYEKFAVWSGCHHRITEILSPLLSPYGDLDALLSAHRGILGCLNHSIVRKYAAPYRLAEIRAHTRRRRPRGGRGARCR